jgi:hypothetical protein
VFSPWFHGDGVGKKTPPSAKTFPRLIAHNLKSVSINRRFTGNKELNFSSSSSSASSKCFVCSNQANVGLFNQNYQ